MDTLSASVDVAFSPNAADAEQEIATIANATLASNTIEAAFCVLSRMVIPGSKQRFGCMRFLLSDSQLLREWVDTR